MSKLVVRVISESEFTVQGHGVHTAYVELTNALRARQDVEVIVNKHGRADVTHIHTVGSYSLGYLLFGSGKKVISAHVVPDSFVGSLAGAKYWLPLAKLYLRWFYNRADLVLAVSEETKRDLEALGVKKPIEVFHNVIDTSRYVAARGDKETARTTLRLPEEGMIVIGAGQIQPRKRVDTFVETARRMPHVLFIWVGGMPFGKAAADWSKMKEMVQNAPHNVQFPGIVPLEIMRTYYQASDIFMLPSDQETFGLVVVEAAAAGLPVVLRDIPDYDETFRSDAIMASEGHFVDKIEQLVVNRPYYDEACEHAGRIAKRFDSANGAERLMGLYHKILGA